MSDRSKSSGSRLRRLLFSGIVLLFFLLLAEAGLRITGHDRRQLSQDDPDLGHRLRPGARALDIEADQRNDVRINSIGYHDRDYSAAKPDNTIRVIFLGDSFTEAREVPVDFNFTKLLEARFRAEGSQVEVMNFGVSGYGTVQQWLLLEQLIPEFKPDYVVLMFYEGNDIRNNSPVLDPKTNRPYLKKMDDGRFELDRSYLEGRDPLFKRMVNVFADGSYLVAWAVDKYVRIRFKRDVRKAGGVGPLPIEYQTFGNERPEVWNDSFEMTREALGRIQKTCEEAGLGWLVVYIPSGLRIQDGDRLDWERDHPAMIDLNWRNVEDRITPWFDEQGVSWVSLFEPLRTNADNAGNELYIKGWGHFTQDGHRIVAEVLFDQLNKQILD